MPITNLLTIAIPVFERFEYFNSALESVINQSVRCHVIVVDNCSSHFKFRDICNERGVTYYRNDENIGLFPNWNRCFELAESEYVMILGDDDILSPNYVESFLFTKEKHMDIDIYYSDFVLNDLSYNKRLSHHHTLPFGYMKNGKKIIEFGIKYGLGFPLITSSVRKSKFTSFYSEFHASNDWLWIYQNANKLVFYGDSKKLYKYGIHQMQDSQNSRSNCILSMAYIYDKILKDKSDKIELKRKTVRNAFWALIRLKAGANKKLIKDFRSRESIYSKYLNYKLKSDILMSLIFNLPRWLIKFLYKLLLKLKLAR